jgi:hypothetical protein
MAVLHFSSECALLQKDRLKNNKQDAFNLSTHTDRKAYKLIALRLWMLRMIYTIIHKSLGKFRNRLRNNQQLSRKDTSSTCKVRQKLGVSLPLLSRSPSAWPSRLMYRRGRTSRMEFELSSIEIDWSVNSRAIKQLKWYGSSLRNHLFQLRNNKPDWIIVPQ